MVCQMYPYYPRFSCIVSSCFDITMHDTVALLHLLVFASICRTYCAANSMRGDLQLPYMLVPYTGFAS